MHAGRLAAIDALLPERKGLSILDFGCGSGEYLCRLLPKGHRGIGLDPAESAIKTARANAVAAGISPDVFVAGSLDALPEQEFDVILAMSVFLFVSEAEERAFFLKASRMLSPDGVVICNFYNQFVDVCTFNKYTIRFLLERCLAGIDSERLASIEDQLRQMLPASGNSPPWTSGSYKDTMEFRVRNPFRLSAEMAAHGFAIDKWLFSRFHLLPPEIAEHPDNFDLYEYQVRHLEEASCSDVGPVFATNMNLRLKPMRG